MKKKLYAAYGSNINLDQMAFRCPRSTVAGTAMLKGYELQFRYHATIEKKEKSEVPILLWNLDPKDEKILDRYEGEPKYYRKENIEVELNGEKVNAMVYIMNGDAPLQAPSAEYYDTIKQGYRENGLDLSYLETAYNDAVLSENEELENMYAMQIDEDDVEYDFDDDEDMDEEYEEMDMEMMF